MLHSCTQSAAFILAQSLAHEAEKQAVKKAKAEKRQAKKQAKAAAKAAARRATRETRAAKKTRQEKAATKAGSVGHGFVTALANCRKMCEKRQVHNQKKAALRRNRRGMAREAPSVHSWFEHSNWPCPARTAEPERTPGMTFATSVGGPSMQPNVRHPALKHFHPSFTASCSWIFCLKKQAKPPGSWTAVLKLLVEWRNWCWHQACFPGF